jgi:hypothetical protein
VHGTQLRKNYRLGLWHEERGAEVAQRSSAKLCGPTDKQKISDEKDSVICFRWTKDILKDS